MNGEKLDNSEFHGKVLSRRSVAKELNDDARVLELFCGEGLMYSAVWNRFNGICADKDNDKVLRAASSRSSWGCYQCDSVRALRDGWLSSLPFDVVDIDAYGEPWTAFIAFIDGHRAFPPSGTTVILTDGFWPQRHNSIWPKSLFGPTYSETRMSGVSDQAYVSMAVEKITGCALKRGLMVDSSESKKRNYAARGVGHHIFVIRKATAGLPIREGTLE